MATYYITKTRKGNAREEKEIVGACINGEFASKAQVYDWIQGGHVFYSRNTNYPNVPDALVEGHKTSSGEKYIQTKADRTAKNNLLNLPDC